MSLIRLTRNNLRVQPTRVSHALTTGANQPAGVRCMVNLLAFHCAHHFDGSGRGKTGEFFFSSIISDGTKHDVLDSRAHTLDGVFDNIGAGQWENLDIGWSRGATVFQAGSSLTSGSLAIAFALVERDGTSEMTSLLDSVPGIVDSVAKAAGAGPGSSLGSAATSIATEALKAISKHYAKNDPVISQHRSIGWKENFGLGRFLDIYEDRPGVGRSAAVFQVMPYDRQLPDDYQEFAGDDMALLHDFEVTPSSDSALSIFLRQNQWNPSLDHYYVGVFVKATGTRVHEEKAAGRYLIVNGVSLSKGTTYVVRFSASMTYRMRAMCTKISASLAAV